MSFSIDSAITVDLQATDEALIVRRGPEQQRFENSAVLPLDDRHTLSISRQELDWRVLVHDRDTPRRASFSGVTWFPVDGRRIVEARYASKSPREPMLLQTSRGVSKTLYVAGEATFELDGTAATLLPPRFNVLPFAIEAGAAQPQH